VLDQVLYIARHLESVGRVVELPKDETSFNSNTPNEIRLRAQNFTIENGYRITIPIRSHLTEDPIVILYNNYRIGEALYGKL
jgi:hypothetical protein